MTLNQDTAAQQYQIASDALMQIAQDYQVSEQVAERTLNAANHLTLQYIDQTINDINELSKQYATFVNYMQSVVADLENTLIDDALVVPLQNALSDAKKYLR